MNQPTIEDYKRIIDSTDRYELGDRIYSNSVIIYDKDKHKSFIFNMKDGLKGLYKILMYNEPDFLICRDIKDLVYELRNAILDADIDSFLTHFCTTLAISREELIKKTRKREIVDLRTVFYHLAKEKFPKASLNQIAQFFDQDHSTILYGLNKIQLLNSLKNLLLKIRPLL